MFEEKYYKFLACPHCKLGLRRGEKDLFCAQCKRKFSIREGVPVIIPDGFDVPTWRRGEREIDTSNLFTKLFTKKNKPFLNIGDKFTLDIGCGDNAEGAINMDVYFPKQIPKNFLIGSAEYLPFIDNSIDVVKSNYVVEHLINPASFILDCVRVAKKEVVITTDNSDWIGEVFMRLIGGGRIFHDEHYYKWSKEYMSNLVKRLCLDGKIEVLNLSTNPLVMALSLLGNLPRISQLFYRDLRVKIVKG